MQHSPKKEGALLNECIQDFIKINWKPTTYNEPVAVEVISKEGKTLHREIVVPSADVLEIAVAHLPVGLHFITADNGRSVYTRRFMKW